MPHHHHHHSSSGHHPEIAIPVHHHSKEASPGAPIDLEHGKNMFQNEGALRNSNFETF